MIAYLIATVVSLIGFVFSASIALRDNLAAAAFALGFFAITLGCAICAAAAQLRYQRTLETRGFDVVSDTDKKSK
jgi:hypothetical protein